MTDDQRDRQKKLSDQVFKEQLNKVQQQKDRDAIEFNRTQAAKKELAQRALARKRLMPFVKRFNPDYQPGWVHIDIAVRLEKFSQAVANKESPRLMLFLPPRHGKQISHSSHVLTSNRGWTTHGDLTTEDTVFSPSGKAINVLALSEETQSDYVVHLSNGEQVRCHENHEWTFWDRGNKKWRTEETRWFLENTNRGTPRKLTSGKIGKRGGRYMFQLPLVENPLEFAHKDLPFDPYTLGAWLGDGSRGKPCISGDKNDSPVVEKINDNGYATSAQWTHSGTGVITTSFANQNVIQDLRALDVLNDKHIPEIYLRSSVKQRLELLAGLIDTEGHNEKHTGRIRFTTADKKLKDSVVDLTTTLGFRPYVIVEQPKLSSSGIQGKQEYYVVGFQPTCEIPCALKRKRPTVFAKQRKVSIADVEYSPNGEKGRCIQVDSSDGLYLVGRSLVPTHNSELASKTFPAWHLGQYPRHEVIASSYAADLAMDFSRKVRGILADPDYGKVFHDTKLDKKSQSAERWNTSVGGGYVAAGVGGAITGRGAHIGIIDDPIKNREDAESASNRQKIKDWYTSTFYTRLAPGGGILVILTRWHDDDLAGWLLEQQQTGGDTWEVVKYPAISTADEFYRKRGEPLHADRYPLESLERIKRAVGERDWSALYQQNPVPDTGAYFQKDWFRYYDKEPQRDKMKIYQAWDFAIGQAEHNDYTVGVTIGVAQDDKVYLLNVCRGKWDALEIVEKIIDEYVAFKPQIVGVERGQIEMALGPMLNKRMQERKVIFGTELLKTGRRDKQARARPLQARMQQGMVLLPKHADLTIELKNEMLRFPAGTHDDQVDAFAWCFQMLDKFTVHRDQKPKKEKTWRDRLSKHIGGSGKRSHMRA